MRKYRCLSLSNGSVSDVYSQRLSQSIWSGDNGDSQRIWNIYSLGILRKYNTNNSCTILNEMSEASAQYGFDL